jgi:stage II sporulation protein D
MTNSPPREDTLGRVVPLVPVLVVSVALAGCRRDKGTLETLEPPRCGPHLEIRLVTEAQVELLLPERIRVLGGAHGDVLFEGSLETWEAGPEKPPETSETQPRDASDAPGGDGGDEEGGDTVSIRKGPTGTVLVRLARKADPPGGLAAPENPPEGSAETVGGQISVPPDGISLGGWVAQGPLEIQLLVPADQEAPVEAGDPPSRARRGPASGLEADACLGAVLRDPQGNRAEHRFRGSFVLSVRKGQLELANRLTLEEYLAGVIGAEMPASSYPMDALKAQAVAARTYALYSILLAAERERRPSFPGTERFQVYGGVAREHPRVLKAVRETVGEILTYRGQLFRAYFHSTCGGRTADAKVVFREPDIPPLRGGICGACDGSRFASWQVRWSGAELASAIRPWLESQEVDLGDIEMIGVSESAPDGRVRYLEIQHSRGSLEIHVNRFRSLLRKLDRVGLRSRAFDVAKEGDAFAFRGAGWGHGVGLCQVGAGRKGETQDYREILAFYYPGSLVEQVY